jgi:uroporphyrin-3 C-methyltransferase
MTDDKGKQGNQKSNAAAGKGGKPARNNPPLAKASGPGAQPAAAAPSKGGGNGLAVLALVVALGAGGGAAYLWTQLDQQRQLAASNAAAAESISSQAGQATQGIEGLKSEVAAVRQELSDQLAKQLEVVEETTEQANQGTQAGISQLNDQVSAQLSATTTSVTELMQGTEAQIATLKGEVDTAKSQMAEVDQTVSEQLAAATQTVAESLQTAEAQMATLRAEIRGEQKTLAERMQAQVDSLQLTQRGLGQSVELVRETMASGGDRNAWTLSEVDYLLQIAAHRLRYQEDVQGALSALVLALQRLNTVDELAFAPVQVILNEEIAALRSAKQLDRAGLAQTLAELADKAYALPLRNDARTQVIKEQAAAKRAGMKADVDTAQAGWLKDAASSAWGEIKDLVVVRHERREAAPLIAPEEEYFLAQNLRLKVEQARLAALLADGSSYQESLETARGWLELYFDNDDEGVVAARDEIKQLQQVELHPYLPDISRSLRTFRDIMETRKPLKTFPDENIDAAGEGAA